MHDTHDLSYMTSRVSEGAFKVERTECPSVCLFLQQWSQALINIIVGTLAVPNIKKETERSQCCWWLWVDERMQKNMEAWHALGGGGTLQYLVQIMGKASWGFWQTYLGPSGRPWAPELILLQVIMWREFQKSRTTPFVLFPYTFLS